MWLANPNVNKHCEMPHLFRKLLGQIAIGSPIRQKAFFFFFLRQHVGHLSARVLRSEVALSALRRCAAILKEGLGITPTDPTTSRSLMCAVWKLVLMGVGCVRCGSCVLGQEIKIHQEIKWCHMIPLLFLIWYNSVTFCKSMPIENPEHIKIDISSIGNRSKTTTNVLQMETLPWESSLI